MSITRLPYFRGQNISSSHCEGGALTGGQRDAESRVPDQSDTAF
jgi:hypothetical protein